MKTLQKLFMPLAFVLIPFGIASAEQQDIIVFEGDSSNEIIIPGEIGDNTTLYFGDTLSHYLRWEADRNMFVFSDNVDFGGNELVNMRIENLDAAPVCEADSSGRLYHNTTNQQAFVCNGSIWKQIDEEAVGGASPFVSEISPASLNAEETTTLRIIGGNFSPDTTVVIPGMTGTLSAVTIVSPTEVTVDVTPDSSNTGSFDILLTSDGLTNASWTDNGVDILEIINLIALIPGVEDSIWERITAATVSAGKLVPSSTATGWNKGASFGTAPADSDIVLSFNPVYMAGQSAGGYAMMGLDSVDPNHEYNSIDYAFYFVNGTDLMIYENGVSRGSFGTFALTDDFSIAREGTTIKYAVNNSVIYTSSVPSSSSLVFDSSLYQYIGAENILLEY